jgi:hypothetical protein
MTFYYNPNQTPTTGSMAMFSFKEQLKVAGWIVKGSGDATSFSTTADIIVSGATGATGLSNTSAWFRVQCPSMGGVTRELCVQRSTTSAQWRIKYSYSAGFTGGAPSATRTPSATDEQYIIGGGTDAAPTFGILFGADASYKYHVAAADSNDGYMFYSVAYAHNAGVLTHILYMDQMQADSVNALDNDGYVFFANNSISTTNTANVHGTSVATNVYAPQCWLKKGLSGETWGVVPIMAYYYVDTGNTTTYSPKAIGINSFDGKDVGLPAIYAKPSNTPGANAGFKGIGRLHKLASSNRSNGTPFDLVTVRDKMQVEIFIFPWNGSVPLV